MPTEEQPITKVCHDCGQAKPIDQFYKSRQGNPLRQCKRCAGIRNNQWMKDHPETRLSISRKPANVEYRKQWSVANPKKLVEYKNRRLAKPGVVEKHRTNAREKRRANAESVNARARELRQLKPEIYRERDARRKARKIEASNAVTSEEKKLIQEYYRKVYAAVTIRCHWCRKPVPRQQREVDHIIPLFRGGRHVVMNLCCSCKSCNAGKCAKLPEEIDGQHLLEF